MLHICNTPAPHILMLHPSDIVKNTEGTQGHTCMSVRMYVGIWPLIAHYCINAKQCVLFPETLCCTNLRMYVCMFGCSSNLYT